MGLRQDPTNAASGHDGSTRLHWARCVGLRRAVKKSLAVWLLGRSIVVVEFTAKEAKPFLEIEHAIIVEVARASFNKKYFLLWKILREPASDDASGGPSADNHVVEVIDC